jgi:hypothetical protein
LPSRRRVRKPPVTPPNIPHHIQEWGERLRVPGWYRCPYSQSAAVSRTEASTTLQTREKRIVLTCRTDSCIWASDCSRRGSDKGGKECNAVLQMIKEEKNYGRLMIPVVILFFIFNKITINNEVFP